MTDFHDSTGTPENRFNVADIQTLIHHLPNRRPFMLGQSLAMIYEVEPKYIARAVKRNPKRFPSDFYFQLTDEEVDILKSQTVTLNAPKSPIVTLNSPRANPYGFHREGANMLSAVLRSDVAAKRSVQIMRAFSVIEAVLLGEIEITATESKVTKPTSHSKRVDPLTCKTRTELMNLQARLSREIHLCRDTTIRASLLDSFGEVCDCLDRPFSRNSFIT